MKSGLVCVRARARVHSLSVNRSRSAAPPADGAAGRAAPVSQGSRLTTCSSISCPVMDNSEAGSSAAELQPLVRVHVGWK